MGRDLASQRAEEEGGSTDHLLPVYQPQGGVDPGHIPAPRGRVPSHHTT